MRNKLLLQLLRDLDTPGSAGKSSTTVLELLSGAGRTFGAVLLGLTSVAFAQSGGTVVNTYTFPDMSISAFQPSPIANERGIRLGGVGSAIWHDRQHDADGIYWMITDRGPTGLAAVPRTFPTPTFTPLILKVRTESNGSISVLSALPLVGASNAGVTGIPNLPLGTAPLGDENPFELKVVINPTTLLPECGSSSPTQIPRNQSALDPEGIVRTEDGNFWLVDEYSTAIVKVNSTGRVVSRFVPSGVSLPLADYAVQQLLPAAFQRRTRNRGFEDLAISPDDRTIFAALQSPLQTTGNNFFNTRILAFDVKQETSEGEWVYRFDDIKTFVDSTGAVETTQSLMKISGLAAIDPRRLLVVERTDFVAKIYKVDIQVATDILGSAYDTTTVSPTLESFISADFASRGISVLQKELVINLEDIPGMPDKIEGIAILDKNTIAVANDNDFQIGGFDSACNNISTGVPSQIIVIRLNQPLW